MGVEEVGGGGVAFPGGVVSGLCRSYRTYGLYRSARERVSIGRLRKFLSPALLSCVLSRRR